mmetsp:Transcript_1493/g.4454  ORF Transcript_1493/g.4454 Transcript_1493/m.4454 type:complete len:229 (+) Transcript_1493:1194-1880(+)
MEGLELRMDRGPVRRVDRHGRGVCIFAFVQQLASASLFSLGTYLLPDVKGLRLGNLFVEALLADHHVLKVHGRGRQERREVGGAEGDACGQDLVVEGDVVLQARPERPHPALLRGALAREPTEDQVHLDVPAPVVEDRKVDVVGLRLQRSEAVVDEHHLVAALEHCDEARAEDQALRGEGDVEGEEHAGGDHVGGVGKVVGPDRLVDRPATGADLEGADAGWRCGWQR